MKQKTILNFNVKLAQVDIEQAIRSLSSLTEEATLNFSPEGLHIRAMDASHVALIDIRMPNSSFERYECESENLIGIKVKEFLDILKSMDKKNTVTIESKAHLILISDKEMKFEFKVIQVNKEDTPLPKIPYDSHIEFENNSFKEFLKRLKRLNKFCEYLTIHTLENNHHEVFLSGVNDNGKIESIFNEVKITCRMEAESTYSYGYLIPFLNTVNDLNVEIDYSKAKPIRVRAKINNVSDMDLYLAPRVEC